VTDCYPECDLPSHEALAAKAARKGGSRQKGKISQKLRKMVAVVSYHHRGPLPSHSPPEHAPICNAPLSVHPPQMLLQFPDDRAPACKGCLDLPYLLPCFDVRGKVVVVVPPQPSASSGVGPPPHARPGLLPHKEQIRPPLCPVVQRIVQLGRLV